MPSLCNAPVVSLEIWLMMVSSCASGSGSSVVGEYAGCPFAEEEAGLAVRWLANSRLDRIEDAVSGGERGRLEAGEMGREANLSDGGASTVRPAGGPPLALGAAFKILNTYG